MAQSPAKMGNQLDLVCLPPSGSILRNFRNTWKAWELKTTSYNHKNSDEAQGALRLFELIIGAGSSSSSLGLKLEVAGGGGCLEGRV